MALIHWSPRLPHFQPSPNDYGYYASGSQRGGLVQKKNQNAQRGFNGGNEIARYVWYQMFLSKVNILISCCILLKIQSVEYNVS
ncbi:hypothetical protein HID58_030600 [Brassica napus]|uniref:Uncharacterized protein n=3 Tax=Brassica TaxID=3705 RepID=A0ABQ8CGD9_BRANA|nr:hypothetical protein HID58_030600 [Brassica napus]CAG7899417.1 unnamed protein product [Brassica rapa]CDY41454.1 BnaA08g20560D [Brassica napus]VDD06847.1 unnamed protein product [Brassica rapa]